MDRSSPSPCSFEVGNITGRETYTSLYGRQPVGERKNERREEKKKNRETELRRAARWTVTLFRDRDPKCARDSRAGINKYTRLRERRDCVLCV